MDFRPTLSHESEVPLYRQLFDQIATRIRTGDFIPGERLPATRELAGLLGLNRTTVSAAYSLLEEHGRCKGAPEAVAGADERGGEGGDGAQRTCPAPKPTRRSIRSWSLRKVNAPAPVVRKRKSDSTTSPSITTW